MTDRSVYDDIYNQYSPKILRYLNSTFSVEDAQDLLQEVFIKVYNSLDSFQQKSSLNTWIYRIATNTVIDKLKSKKYVFNKDHADIDNEKIQYDNRHFSPVFGKQIEKDEMYDCIRQFIDELTEKNKIVFVLSQYQDLSNAEISEVLNISIDSVKIRLHRSREALKANLRKNCNFYYDSDGDMVCEPK